MAMTKEQILNEAMSLSARDRDEVAESLWQCIAASELAPEQISEVRRRVRALEGGQALPIPGEDVMQELRQRFRR